MILSAKGVLLSYYYNLNLLQKGLAQGRFKGLSSAGNQFIMQGRLRAIVNLFTGPSKDKPQGREGPTSYYYNAMDKKLPALYKADIKKTGPTRACLTGPY